MPKSTFAELTSRWANTRAARPLAAVTLGLGFGLALVASGPALSQTSSAQKASSIPAAFAPNAMASRIPNSDRTKATQQHPQILSEFGGALEGRLAAYVKSVGDRTATAAGVQGLCTFTVVNSDVVNAFAVPGCYIYVTRGLLAIMNSEDELASVLGHEVRHVTGEHSKKRSRANTLGTLGAIALGVATRSQDLMQAAGQLAQVYTLSYSRDQENDSDNYGVRYLYHNGYNAFAAADMLAALGTHEALDTKVNNREARTVPNWARSHPLSQERVTKTTAAARAFGATPTSPAEKVTPYFAAISGMRVGDDPEQGYINGRVFAHPTLKLTFEVPVGFTLNNTPSAVQIAGSNNIRSQFSGGQSLQATSLEAYATAVLRQILGQTQAQMGTVQTATVNGLPAASVLARATNAQRQVVDVAVMAYNVNGRAYHFAVVGPGGQLNASFPMTQSLRLLSDAEIAALKPREMEIVTVRAGDTVESLSRRMAYDAFQTDRFVAMNALQPNQALRAGTQVKIVRYGSAKSADMQETQARSWASTGAASSSLGLDAPKPPVTMAGVDTHAGHDHTGH
jgi:predicted Zn-dependent protease